jgi:hypothetical protein
LRRYRESAGETLTLPRYDPRESMSAEYVGRISCPFGCNKFNVRLLGGVIEHNLIAHMRVCLDRPKGYPAA